MDYEQDMYIDENALDIEWLEQPQLMRKYSAVLANLEREQDLVKEELDLVKAELDKKIRENPEEFGILKVTESAINSVIILSEEYVKVMRKYINIKYEVKVAVGVVRAVDQRKSSLENLVKLHGQNYFAGPSVPHDLGGLRKEKQKEQNSRISKTINRTRN